MFRSFPKNLKTNETSVCFLVLFLRIYLFFDHGIDSTFSPFFLLNPDWQRIDHSFVNLVIKSNILKSYQNWKIHNLRITSYSSLVCRQITDAKDDKSFNNMMRTMLIIILPPQ